VLASVKQAQLVAFRGSAPMNDYVYQLTDKGREIVFSGSVLDWSAD